LPGCGESDPSPHLGASAAAGAVSDLASDLRLRQIDLLGVHGGTSAALALAASRPELVRRLVLLGVPHIEALPTVKQPALVIRTRSDAAEGLARLKAALPNARYAEIADAPEKLFEADVKSLTTQVGAFLSSRS
jgi:pimeloyl-ACP methyl ester carboxylesterase